MFSGCFGTMKAKVTIKLSGKRAIINSMRITLYHTALLLLCQIKYLSLSLYSLTYTLNSGLFKMTLENEMYFLTNMTSTDHILEYNISSCYSCFF